MQHRKEQEQCPRYSDFHDAGVIEDVLRDREGVSIANYNCPKSDCIGEGKAADEAGNALAVNIRRVLPL